MSVLRAGRVSTSGCEFVLCTLLCRVATAVFCWYVSIMTVEEVENSILLLLTAELNAPVIA